MVRPASHFQLSYMTILALSLIVDHTMEGSSPRSHLLTGYPVSREMNYVGFLLFR
jgi:hypothetical protein